MARGRFTSLCCNMPGMFAVIAESRHSFARHTHEQFGIGVIERGAQHSLSGRGRVEAGPGDVITVNPREVHDGTPVSDEGRCWRMLYIDLQLMAGLADDLGEACSRDYEFSHPVIRDGRLANRFRRLFAAVTNTADTADIQHEELLLGLLAAAQTDRPMRDSPSFPAALLRARMRIDDDPAAPVTLAELARESEMSRFQLLRAFTRATGMTPHAYLIQRRIDLARQLIAAGSALTDAALASGFADQSHMTRVFTRKYGLSPRSFAVAMA
jgi:AraC-like DNA-binding protein